MTENPFIKAGKESLLTACNEELARLGEDFGVPVHLEFQALLCIVANLQLALRHPGNNGLSSEVARKFAEGLIGRIRDAGYTANAEMLCAGFDPAYDDEAPSRPQLVPVAEMPPAGNGLKSESGRIAASECVRLMGMLTESDIPEAKALATIVGSRLATIADEGAGESLDVEDIAPWVEIGRRLCIVVTDAIGQSMTGFSCPCETPHCERCGCCVHKACEGGCFWVTPTLCSKCVGVA